MNIATPRAVSVRVADHVSQHPAVLSAALSLAVIPQTYPIPHPADTLIVAGMAPQTKACTVGVPLYWGWLVAWRNRLCLVRHNDPCPTTICQSRGLALLGSTHYVTPVLRSDDASVMTVAEGGGEVPGTFRSACPCYVTNEVNWNRVADYVLPI